MAELLPPAPFLEPLVERERLTITAFWLRWVDALFRRQGSVETRLAALEQRVFDLENP